jgi:hypothetical protein
VVILRTLVGNRTGPLTLRSLSLARAIKSAHTTRQRILNGKSWANSQGSRGGGGTFLDILDVTRSQGDADAVDLDGSLGLFCFFSSFSDYILNIAQAGSHTVAHVEPEGD